MFQGRDVEWNIRHRVNQLKKERKKRQSYLDPSLPVGLVMVDFSVYLNLNVIS